MSVTGPFLGMMGTGGWVDGEVPDNIREGILYLYPNGAAPLTAMLAKMESESVTNTNFGWFTQGLSEKGGYFNSSHTNGLFTNSGLTVAYAGGGVKGDILFLKSGASANTGHVANLSEFKGGHLITIGNPSYPNLFTLAYAMDDPTINGTSSSLKLKLLEDDDNATTDSKDLSDATIFYATGSAYGQGGMPPTELNSVPTKFDNNTQIYKGTWKLSRTARQTSTRTSKDQEAKKKKEAMQDFMIDQETGAFWGVKGDDTDKDGNPITYTRGIVNFIREYAPSNIFNFARDPNYSGKSWLESGEDWLNALMEQVFRYGPGTDRLMFCSNGVLSGINRLVRNYGNIELTKMTAAYGIKVTEWVTPFGSLYFKTHPLFNHRMDMAGAGVIMPVGMLKSRVMQDEKYEDTKIPGFDGTSGQYLCEKGLELHHPEMWGLVFGFDQDNVV